VRESGHAVAQAGRTRVQFPARALVIPVEPVVPAALWPWGRFGLCRQLVREMNKRPVGTPRLPNPRSLSPVSDLTDGSWSESAG
jgi:hypothetical protein